MNKIAATCINNRDVRSAKANGYKIIAKSIAPTTGACHRIQSLCPPLTSPSLSRNNVPIKSHPAIKRIEKNADNGGVDNNWSILNI